MLIQPYLFFDGRSEEAIAFYKEAIGAQVLVQMRFGDGPPGESGCGDGSAPPPDKIMHACLQIGDTQLMLSDGFSLGNAEFKGITLSLTAPDDGEARRLFDRLAAGGTITQALAPSFFASSFGMLSDRFGVSWMVVVPLPMAA
ncbi:VOC family protein [Dokdonella sp.]|uniref:VOC family protein n=1 Tax=Dokdonella sp. TaxID=2291710 RepID=UPI002BE930B3|nr:VOC family protein [Dokdonella sp.]HOX72219.1 VOC family protein [Dokdonella sp.]HPN79514.1 VOC family protein [Dokdonella sp.]